MKTNTNYVEWLNADVMHSSSLRWLSELRFIKDEQRFLDDLVKSYTLHLIDSSHFEKSKKIVTTLSSLQSETTKLLKMVKAHESGLEIMVDDINQPLEEEAYKKTHQGLIVAIHEFFGRYRSLKTELFDLIKTILKEEKQKRLLKNM